MCLSRVPTTLTNGGESPSIQTDLDGYYAEEKLAKSAIYTHVLFNPFDFSNEADLFFYSRGKLVCERELLGICHCLPFITMIFFLTFSSLIT